MPNDRAAARRKRQEKASSIIVGTSRTVELTVKVSERTNIKGYGFAFDGVPVPLRNGLGRFQAKPGVTKLLEWVMIGEPKGFMKVTVARDRIKIAEREKSTIPAGYGEGYDALEIKI